MTIMKLDYDSNPNLLCPVLCIVPKQKKFVNKVPISQVDSFLHDLFCFKVYIFHFSFIV